MGSGTIPIYVGHLVSIVIIFLLYHSSKNLFPEIYFYKYNGWDFQKRSGRKIFLGDELAEFYPFLDYGHGRLLVLGSFFLSFIGITALYVFNILSIFNQ